MTDPYDLRIVLRGADLRDLSARSGLPIRLDRSISLPAGRHQSRRQPTAGARGRGATPPTATLEPEPAAGPRDGYADARQRQPCGRGSRPQDR